MKKIKLLQLIILATIVSVTISCKKSSEIATQASQPISSMKNEPEQLVINSLNELLIDSLVRKGYVKQVKLSNSKIVCYTKGDTTKFINLTVTASDKSLKRNASADYGMFRMFSNTSVQSGVMSAVCDEIDDTGSMAPDLAFNCWAYTWNSIETVGLMIYNTEQGPGKLWGYAGESFVTIKVWGRSGNLGNLDGAIAVDPVASFIRLE